MVTTPPLVIAAAKVTALGAIAVNPPPKLKVVVEAPPNVNVPVFAKVTKLVMLFTAPNNPKL